ncbi:methyltransferase family protein [Synechococcus sp. MIT S9503]|uniref:methyltransferase family protein n=1 Tax=Synechococcus sp. MIT S9503 TaxID=3082547 RepID=UPI0039A57441
MPDWKQALSGWGLSWNGWFDNRRGEWWLVAQLVLISAHLIPAWPKPASVGIDWPHTAQITGLIILAIGLGQAAQGLIALGPSLSPLPEPKPGASLVTTGVYGHCRHPLYRAVLMCSLGVVLALGSLLHLLLLLALAIVLTGKARREERALLQLLPSYADYMRTTAAIVAHCPGLDWRRPEAS